MEDTRRFILSVSTRRCFEFLRDGWHDGVNWIGSRCGGDPKCYTTQKKVHCVGAEILGKGMSRQLEELKQQQPEILSMLCLSQRTLTKVRSSHIGVCGVSRPWSVCGVSRPWSVCGVSRPWSTSWQN
ncbi:hypothetical protein Pmani_019434 [Petrolisthes manimaculis]|uniref:Uncharacterized protein n=1 Tax=Petrolisthes manimaculis TaxID=1843537 RepID=A0AAE1PKF3_9EUCA|nr:hypothetical protein Pmani_019434 [Petrolisthes manimaculis]